MGKHFSYRKPKELTTSDSKNLIHFPGASQQPNGWIEIVRRLRMIVERRREEEEWNRSWPWKSSRVSESSREFSQGR